MTLKARIPYSALPDRPRLTWPENARLAVWVVPNLEHYEFLPEPRGPRDPWPRVPHPDILNYGIRDYGNRVGVWRLFDLLDRYNITATVSLNVAVFAHYPRLLAECESRGWDYLCHGMYNTRYHWELNEEEERAEIAACVELFRELVGKRMAGWFSPALSLTDRTPDLIAEAGFMYYTDWVHDEQPFPFIVRGGQRLISVPYSTDLNDAVVLRSGHDAAYFAKTAIDHFDRLYEDGAVTGRVMCIAIHPYIFGQPHRIAALEEVLAHITRRSEIWMTTGAEIAKHYLTTAYDEVMASLERPSDDP